MKQENFTSTQQKFINKFIDMLYYNMVIEDEAPYSKSEFYDKYKQDAIDLIKDGSYKKVKF